MRRIRGTAGFTLVEIMIVVAIIGIMVLVLGTSFQGWMEKHKVEDQAKRLFTDVAEARTRALQRNRVHFVQLQSNGYQAYEDTSPGPDGDRVLTVGADTRIVNGQTDYAMASGAGMPAQIDFSREGIPAVGGVPVAPGTSLAVNLTYPSSLSPEYDCINITTTRIRLGRMNGADCQER